MNNSLQPTAVGAPRRTAVVGFDANGHFSFYLRALQQAGRGFVFIGSKELWRRVIVDLPAAQGTDSWLHDDQPEDSPADEFDWLENIVAQDGSIKRILFLHLNRYPRQLLTLAWRRRWPALARCELRGVLVTPQVFYERRRRHERREFLKWNAWIVAVTRAPRPLCLLMLSTTGRSPLPGMVRALVRGGVQLCPEPYDRLSVPDNLPSSQDTKPPAVLIFGFHTPRKGTAWALRALADSTTPIRLIVAGDCEQPAELTTLAAALPAPVQVELRLHRIDETLKQTLFKRSTVAALPYLGYYGSSGVLFEALIYRCRVVISSICEVSADLLSSGAVHVYPVGDQAGFLRALDAACSATVDWTPVDIFLGRHGVHAFAAVALHD